MADFVQGIKVVASTEGAEKVAALGVEFDNLKSKSEGAAVAARTSGGDFDMLESAMGRLERRIVMVAAQWLLYKGIVDGLKGADAYRDLGTSLEQIEGNTIRGANALKLFNDIALTTRDTALKLGETFERLYRNNTGKGGFSSDQNLVAFVADLSGAAVAAKVSTDAMNQFWEAVKQGNGKVNKDILHELGLTKEDAKDINKVRDAIVEAADRGKEFGQTLESTLTHVKDQWVISFAGAGPEAKNAYAAILKEFTKPELLNTIHEIGEATLRLLPVLSVAFTAMYHALAVTLEALVSGFAASASLIIAPFTAVADALDKAGNTNSKGERGKGILSGTASGNMLAGAATALDTYQIGLMGVSKIEDSAATESIKKLTTLFDEQVPKLAAAAAGHKELGDVLTTNADKTAKAEAAARKYQAAQIEMVNTTARVTREIDTMNKIMMTDQDASESPLTKKIRLLTEQSHAQLMIMEKDWDDLRIKIELAPKTGLDPSIVAGYRTEWEKLGVSIRGYDAGLASAIQKLKDTEALKAIQAWAVETEKLGIGWQRVSDTINNTTESLKQKFGQTSQNPFVQGYVENVPEMLKAAKQMEMDIYTDVTIPNDEARRKAMDLNQQKWTEAIRAAGAEAAKAADKWKAEVTDRFGPLLQDALTTGGKNFGQIAAGFFTSTLKDAGGQLTDIFGKAVLGAFGVKTHTAAEFSDESDPQASADAANAQNSLQATKITGAIGAAIGGITHLVDVATGKVAESALQTIVSMTATGASIGSLFGGYGAIIGAVVGLVAGIAAAISVPSGDKRYPYATFGFDNTGAASFKGNQNVSATQNIDALNQLKDTTQGFFDAYVKILLKFPVTLLADIIPKFSDIVNASLNPIIGGTLKQNGGLGDIGASASEHFFDNFTAFVKNTLPKAIEEKFKGNFSTAFESMGMTSAAFGKIWDQLKGMDPKAALQVLSDMADALIAFQNVSDGMNRLGGLALTNAITSGNTINKDGSIRQAAGVNDFVQSIRDAKPDLDKLGIAVKTLVGPDQAAAAAALGKAEQQLFDNLVNYLNKLSQMSAALTQSINDKIFNAAIDKAGTDPNGKNIQSSLFQNRYENDLYQINNADKLGLTADQLNQLVQDASTMLTNMYQLDPTKRYDWYVNSLNTLNTAQQAAYATLGTQARNAVQTVLDSLTPVTNWFKGLPDAAKPAMDKFATQIDAAATNVKHFNDAFTAPGAVHPQGAGAVTTSGANAVTVSIEVTDPGNAVRSIRSRRTSSRG